MPCFLNLFISLTFALFLKNSITHTSISPPLHDTTMVEITLLDKTILLDIRYATKRNFTKKILYPCPKAYLRHRVALALVEAHQKLKTKGFRIKIYDAYRPLSVQWKLWEMYGNPDYVADPRKGSMHNRGAAVDLTLVDAKGKELDMGTDFDFFGEKAHSNYQKLPQKVLENRALLKQTLESVGFAGIQTEWWHFSYTLQKFQLSDEPFHCK